MGHGLDVFDIADPASPKRVGELDYPPFYLRGLDMWTVRTSGGLLVAAQTHNGLFAVDISDRTAPKVLDRWTCPNPKYPDRPSDCVGSVAIGDGATLSFRDITANATFNGAIRGTGHIVSLSYIQEMIFLHVIVIFGMKNKFFRRRILFIEIILRIAIVG